MQFNKSIVHSFSKSKRTDLYTSDSQIPGPGQYNYAKYFGLRKNDKGCK